MLRRSLLVALGSILLAAAPAFCALTWTPDPVDFGYVDPALSYTLNVTITNPDVVGASDAIVQDVAITDSGNFNAFSLGTITDPGGNPLTLPFPSFALAPGQSFTVQMKFTPYVNEAPGTPYSGAARIAYDGTSTPDIFLYGTVRNTGTLDASTPLLDFGSVPSNATSPSLVVNVDNNSSTDITFDSVAITGDTAGVFQANVPSPPTVLKLQQFPVSVTFSPPPAVPGTRYSGTLAYFYSFNAVPQTIEVGLTGSVASSGGGGGTTETETPGGEEGLFIGPCFLDALSF